MRVARVSLGLCYLGSVILGGGALGCGDSETAAGAGGSGGAGGGDGGTPTACDYPDPMTGVGVEVGLILSKTLKWTGYAPGSDMPSDVPISALHDCDGTHGIHALLLSTVQPETGATGNHVVAVKAKLADWADRGITVAFLMLNNGDGSEVTPDGVTDWRQAFMLEDTYVLADRDFLLVSGGQVNTPQNTIVDPRTMEVIAIEEGHPFDSAALEQLADDNAP